MIGYLRGILKDYNEENCLLDVSGVGYEVFIPSSALPDMQSQLGQIVEFWIHTHVREDALHLFGFPSPEEKSFFLTLLKVNGVGPKMAVNILSGATVEQIVSMIEAEDVKALSKLPKVGKKTAEQMILTLKGKLVIAPSQKASRQGVHSQEIISALVNLGYRHQDVEKVIEHLPSDVSIQEGVRRGLQALAKAL